MDLIIDLQDHTGKSHRNRKLKFGDKATVEQLQDQIQSTFQLPVDYQEIFCGEERIDLLDSNSLLSQLNLKRVKGLIVKHSGLPSWKAFLANYDLALNRKGDVEAVDVALDYLRPLVKAKFLVTYPAYDETYRQFKAHFSHRMDQTFKYIEIAVRDYLSKVLNDNAECPTLQFKCEKKAPEESGIQASFYIGGLICNVLRVVRADTRRTKSALHTKRSHYSGLTLYIGTEQVPGFRRADAEGVEISKEMWAQRDFLRRVLLTTISTIQRYRNICMGTKAGKEAKNCASEWQRIASTHGNFRMCSTKLMQESPTKKNYFKSIPSATCQVEVWLSLEGSGRGILGCPRFLKNVLYDNLLNFGNTVYECMQRKIVHRDIKNENIVIDLISGNTKRIDFGAATFTSSRRRRNFQGTRLYTAPEYFHSALYLDMEATVWSVGVVLYSALNGQLPFLTQKDVMTKHLLGPLPKFPVYSTEAEELIRSCLAYEPSDRISLKALRSHRWLSRLENSDWESLTKDLKIMKNDLKSLSSSSFESGVGSSNEQSNAIVLDETNHQYNDTSSTRRTKHQDVKLSAIDCPETHERKSRRILPKMSQNSGISSPLASPLILKH
ncbi:hypothetical protein M3Y96_01086700 [Aphelenchoides besseyi]|nr:hypothetical protein M3Y96_01086700 [Aphelenchoides besseyi]